MTRSNQHSLSSIAAEAADWLIELQTPGVATEQREAFVAWLLRSPVHVDEFLRLISLQGDLARLPELREVDVSKLLERLDLGDSGGNVVALAPDVGRESPPGALVAAPPRRSRHWARAAVVVFTSLVVMLAAPQVLELLRTERYATEPGEQRSLTLADGSNVELNVRSHLSVRVDEAARNVELDNGEALFKVAKDPARPFSVRTPQAVIEALGTVFNVDADERSTHVVLIEGSVQVRARDGSSVILQPGEQVRIGSEAAASLAVPQPANVTAAIAWTERRLVFEDAPLSEVIDEFNRYSRHRFVLQDPDLHLRLTASFDADNAEAFARSLEAVGVRIVRTPDGWRVERGASAPR